MFKHLQCLRKRVCYRSCKVACGSEIIGALFCCDIQQSHMMTQWRAGQHSAGMSPKLLFHQQAVSLTFFVLLVGLGIGKDFPIWYSSRYMGHNTNISQYTVIWCILWYIAILYLVHWKCKNRSKDSQLLTQDPHPKDSANNVKWYSHVSHGDKTTIPPPPPCLEAL